MASLSDSHSGSKEEFFCEVCRQTMQLDQQQEHLDGKKHKRAAQRTKFERGADKGIVVPSGMQIIIEQNALYNDAVATYVLSLYKRGALRSRL